MSKSAPAAKIELASPQTITLDKLSIHEANVRQIKAGVSIESLAADIARRGLLQSLSVRPLLDEAGYETGLYGVQAGGRRLRALQLLVKQKKLAKNAPVSCIVRTEGFVEADSLAENTEREALHPLDQFRAFAALRDKGQGEDSIAAAFGVTPPTSRAQLSRAAMKAGVEGDPDRDAPIGSHCSFSHGSSPQSDGNHYTLHIELDVILGKQGLSNKIKYIHICCNNITYVN